MSTRRLGISAALAAALALAAPGAHAIYINTDTFRAEGGDPANIAGTYFKATQHRKTRSAQAPFDAVGQLTASHGFCTGTWLGNDDQHAWVLTAKHCVTSEWQHWTFAAPGALTVSGLARRHLASAENADIAWDIALLAIPLGVPSPRWNTVTKPALYDGSDEAGKAVHMVGTGMQGVGTSTLMNGRMWGTTRVLNAFDKGRGLATGYQATGQTDLQVRSAPGDSGGAYWQQHAGGYWGIVAVHSWSGGYGSQGTRVNRHVEWIKRVYPGASVFSDRFKVTEARAFVSRNFAEDVDRGTVYYVVAAGQSGVQGPTAPVWSGVRTHSNITVTAKDTITGIEHPLVLRASRDNGCGGGLRMEDGVMCYSAKMGPLSVAFHAEDNVTLPSGEWKAKFDVEAMGWHRPYRERLPISVDVRNLVHGRVSKTAAYWSPNYATAASRGTVYYVVPPQAGATGPTQGVWTGQRTHSTIRVLAKEASTGFERHIVLRANRHNGCGARRMEDGVMCSGMKMGPLSVAYHPADNADLAPGKWRGVLFLRAKGWHDKAVDEGLRLDVEIEQ
jgi:hypothetical protein